MQDGSKKACFHHVVKDGKVADMTVDEIFNSGDFSELMAVTFVASPKFFFNTIEGFKKITLVLGIEDNVHLSKFTEAEAIKTALDPKNYLGFWNDCPDEIREKIKNGSIKVLYAKLKYAIHSKIYLMRGPQKNRVVLGSANFTQMAFKGQRQFEEVLVFDDSPYFDIYLKRFNEILAYTQDFIPDRIKKSKKVLLISDPEVLKDVSIDAINVNRQDLVVTEEVFEALKQSPAGYDEKKKEVQAVINVIDNVFKKKKDTGEFVPIPAKQLQEKVGAIKSIYAKIPRDLETFDERGTFFIDDGDNYLYRTDENGIGEGTHRVELLSKKTNDLELIKENLKLVIGFVEAYSLFTANKDPNTLSRVFEAILYAFTAPYLWKMRDIHAVQHGENARAAFPAFLILAGRARSGKTSLLEFISALLGTSKHLSYPKLSGSNVLLNLFFAENIHPLLVDEVHINFFRSTRSYIGESLVKQVTNDMYGKHPCMIGITNAKGFNASHQVMRRVYYLEVSNAFKESSESKAYLNDKMNRATTYLFQDFTYQLAEWLKTGQPFYESPDFLCAGRRIFLNYFKRTEIEIPQWFPMSVCDDYRLRAKVVWKNLYKRNKNCFVPQGKNSLFVDIANFSTSDREKESQLNLLPPECIREDSHGVVLLNEKEFYDFIEHNPPWWGKINFLKKS